MAEVKADWISLRDEVEAVIAEEERRKKELQKTHYNLYITDFAQMQRYVTQPGLLFTKQSKWDKNNTERFLDDD